jgi:hypothetical protein
MEYLAKSFTNRLALKIEQDSVLLTVKDGNFNVVLCVMIIKRSPTTQEAQIESATLHCVFYFHQVLSRESSIQYVEGAMTSNVHNSRLLHKMSDPTGSFNFREETLLLEFTSFQCRASSLA